MLWFRGRDRERDLERELRSDLELEAADQEANGLSAEAARYAARRAFGNTTRIREDVRGIWGGRWLEDFFGDVRYTLRQLWKAPGFTAAAVLTLAVGIGANAAIFTLIDAVLMKSLPVRDPASLVVLGDAKASGSGQGIPRNGSFSLYSYDLYKHLEGSKVFAGLCAMQSTTETGVSVRREGWNESQLGQTRLVSGNYFSVLGVNAALGRVITPADDGPSAAAVAVVSFRYWKDRMGGDPGVIGSPVDLSGVSFVIIGVAPPEFYGETLTADPPGFWVPLGADRQLNRTRELIDDPGTHWLYLMGRLAPGVSAKQAQMRLTTGLRNWLLMRQGAVMPEERRARIMRSYIALMPGGSGIVHMKRAYSQTLHLLLGISTAILLITCANIASLLLARGAARTSETSLRLALGASRERLARQSFAESLILALAGGALGLFVASVGSRLLIALFFQGTDYVPIETTPDGKVLAFTFAVSCGAAVVFGLLPALRMSSQVALKRIQRAPVAFGAGLIVGEVALSLVVLAGAGTFARSLANLGEQPFGFEREHVVTVDIDPAHAGYEYQRLGPLYQEMDSRLNALPGVKSASLSYYSPFNGCCSAFSAAVEGYTPKAGEELSIRLNRVSPAYFRTLGTKVLSGRVFDERDSQGSRRVAVVTEEFVRRYLAHENPIGRRFATDDNADKLEIVGVVANAKYDSAREGARAMAFLPLLQVSGGELAAASDESIFVRVVEVRSSGRPETVATEVRRALTEIDPELPVLRVSTLSEHVNRELNQDHAIAALALLFGLVALILSCLGLYGLMSYRVQRRTSEIGVRMALGAPRGSILRMVIREALVKGSIGVLVGIPAAFCALKLVANQLYGVSPNNPMYSAGAAGVLLLCMGVAAAIPGVRAARVDPLIALRHE